MTTILFIFFESELTKLAHLVKFKRVLICLVREIEGTRLFAPSPLS